MEQEDDLDWELKIPSNSFTAFRLKYCDAFELYNTSAVLFIGNIPNAWILDKKSILLANIYRFNNINSSHIAKSSSLDSFEDAIITNNDEIHSNNTALSNTHNNINRSHLSLKNDILLKIFNNKNKISHLKSHNGEKQSISDLEINSNDHHSLLPKVTNHYSIINIHPIDNDDDNHNITGDTPSNDNKNDKLMNFNVPRESIYRKNSKFHAFLDNNYQKHRKHRKHRNLNESDNSYNNLFSDDEENEMKSKFLNSLPLSQNLQNLEMNDDIINNHKNDSFESNKSLYSNLKSDSIKSFFEKPEKEKQKILELKLNDAMMALQNNYHDKNYNSINGISSDSDLESFVTASEEPINSSSDKINLIDKPESNLSTVFKDNRTVSFRSPHNYKMHKSSSIYTLQSQKLSLDKQVPTPYDKDDLKDFVTEENGKDEITNEVYTEIDDDIAETYKLLKSKTLDAKVGLNGEINKMEQKMKIKKLLQNFQAGEIIKMEKMLVLVSEIEKFKLNTDSKHDLRIIERWREYITVVRATDDVDYPAIIQFYKSNKIFRKDDTNNLNREVYQEELENQRLEDEAEAAAEEEEDEKTSVTHENNDGTMDEFGVDDSEDDSDVDNVTDKDTMKSTLKSTINNLKNKKLPKKQNINKISKKIAKDPIKIDKLNLPNQNSNHKKNRHCQFSFVISRRDVKVEFANLLDKSIQITKDKRRSTIIYTLLAHSSSSAISWLSFFKELLEPKSLDSNGGTLLISLPSLDVSFTITGAASIYKTLVAENNINSEYITIKFTKDGYKFSRNESFKILLDMIEQQVTMLCNNGKVSDDPITREFLNKLKNDRSFLALTFRKYDRLEWIFGENENIVQILWSILGSAYELELREFQHESHILNDRTMIEPLPIEGFVVKLSNRRGKHSSLLGRQYFKLFYGFTVENLLFFQNFYDAVPIFPKSKKSARHFISPTGSVLDMQTLENAAKFDPILHEITPYPRSVHHIKWLKPGITKDEYENHDADALYEAERRAYMISNADSVVDLCKVTDIRLVPKNKISLVLRTASIATWGRNSQKNNDENTKTLTKTLTRSTLLNDDKDDSNDENIENCLDLIMDDGTSLRLQVANRTVRNEWAKNLTKLSEYWTLKKREDLIRRVVLREKNLSLMNSTNANYESAVAHERVTSCSKWELSKAYTDTQLYSISSYVLDKPVLMEGYIYCKKFKSKQFKLFYVVLSPGFLVLYEIFNRSKATSVARNSTYYRKYATISLASCYVFAGSGKSNANEKDKSLFNSSFGANGLPRVYVDGWKSTESSYERSFTIWFGSKKIMLKNIKKKRDINSNINEEGTNFKNNADSIQSDTDVESSDDESEVSGYDAFHNKRGHKKKKRSFSFGRKLNSGKYDSSLSDNSDSASENGTDSSTSEYSDSGDESDSDLDYGKNVFRKSNLETASKATTGELLKSISRFGVRGRALVFLARSRIDRDLWVTRLMTEVERFSGNRNSDIQLV